MAKKKITVRTVKKKAAVEIQPDASGPAPVAAAAPAAAPEKKGLSVAASGAAPAPVSDHLANPFEDAPVAAEAAGGPPKGYAWQAILMCICTLLLIGVVVIQYLEWDHYHGGFEPVFMKTEPGMAAPRPMAAPAPAPMPDAADAGLTEAPAEAPAEEAAPADAPVE